MARRVSEAQKAAAAIQAARLMIGRGERPGYRLTPARGGAWAVIGLPGVIVTAGSRREALSAARAAIAAVLDIDGHAFDLESGMAVTWSMGSLTPEPGHRAPPWLRVNVFQWARGPR